MNNSNTLYSEMDMRLMFILGRVSTYTEIAGEFQEPSTTDKNIVLDTLDKKTVSTANKELMTNLYLYYNNISESALVLLLGNDINISTIANIPRIIDRYISDARLSLTVFGDEPYKKILVLVKSDLEDDDLIEEVHKFNNEWWCKKENYNNSILIDIDYDV